MTLVDTSIIIDFIAGNEKTVSSIQALLAEGEIKTTSITEYELLRHKSKLKRQLAEDFLSELTIYPFDEGAAREAAMLFIELQTKGKMLNQNDLLIAGIAMAHGEVLLTRDQKLANINKNNFRTI